MFTFRLIYFIALPLVDFCIHLLLGLIFDLCLFFPTLSLPVSMMGSTEKVGGQ